MLTLVEEYEKKNKEKERLQYIECLNALKCVISEFEDDQNYDKAIAKIKGIGNYVERLNRKYGV